MSRKRKEPVAEPTEEQKACFELFWQAYWRRVAKKAAAVAYHRAVTTLEAHERVMEAVRAQTPEMIRRDVEFRPHPATWLNQERWTDEVAGSPRRTPPPAAGAAELQKLLDEATPEDRRWFEEKMGGAVN